MPFHSTSPTSLEKPSFPAEEEEEEEGGGGDEPTWFPFKFPRDGMNGAF